MKLRTGKLPWEKILKKYDSEEFGPKLKRELTESKRSPVEEICRGTCRELEIFLDDVRGLGFYERPDYDVYYELFEKALNRRGYTINSPLMLC